MTLQVDEREREKLNCPVSIISMLYQSLLHSTIKRQSYRITLKIPSGPPGPAASIDASGAKTAPDARVRNLTKYRTVFITRRSLRPIVQSYDTKAPRCAQWVASTPEEGLTQI